MKKYFAMAIPILPGKTQQFKKFTDALNGTRSSDFIKSRKKLNVRERTFFQTTPQGDFVIVTLEGNDPENAFKNFAKTDDDFTRWFTKEVKEIHGIDLSSPPKGPMPQLIVDSKEEVYQIS
jgi:hypothetical protein